MTSLEDLSSSFDSRLECLRTLIDLQYASEEVDCNKHFEHLLNEVEKLENVMAMMRSMIDKQKEKCEQIQELKLMFQKLIGHLQYSCVNVPAHIPLPVKMDSVVHEAKAKSVSHTTQAPQTKASTKGSGKLDAYRMLEYVTVEEFEGVPKYMKGRLTYSQLNASIDELNKPFKEKYKILAMKRSTLNDVNRKRFEKYKLQETNDTSGEYFIVDDDIKEFSSLKLDSVGRAILTVLRHCGRIKEIRGSGLTRYACLPVY